MRHFIRTAILFMIMSFLIGNNLFSQTGTINSATSVSEAFDSLSTDNDAFLEVIRYRLLQEFTKIATGETGNFSNFATLDTKDASAALSAGIFIGKNKTSILGINASGGVTEGFQPLLNGENLSPNVKFGLQYNLGVFGAANRRNAYIRGDATTLFNHQRSIDSLTAVYKKKEHEIEMLGFRLRKQLADIQKKNAQLNKELKLKENQQESGKKKVQSDPIPLSPTELADAFDKRELLRSELRTVASNMEKAAVQKQIDSVNKVITDKYFYKSIVKTLSTDEVAQLISDTSKLNLEINFNESQIIELEKQLIPDNMANEITRLGQNSWEEEREAHKSLLKLNKIALHSYAFRWVSFILNFQNRTFQFFDSNKPFAEQLTTKSPTNFEIGVSFSHYNLNKGCLGSFFSALSLLYSNDGNFNSLDAVKIDDRNTLLTSPVSRSIATQTTAYTGEEFDSFISSFQFSWDVYKFLSNSQRYAFHINPQYISNQDITNLNIGFLMGFRDQKDSKNTINAEIFYSMQDLFKGEDSDSNKTLADRSVFGLQFTTPILFKTKIDD